MPTLLFVDDDNRVHTEQESAERKNYLYNHPAIPYIDIFV